MSHARAEGGFALIVTMSVLAILLMVGVGALTAVESAERRSGDTRVRETAFALAEASMGQQLLALSTRWPSTQATALPATCTRAQAPAGCPAPGSLSEVFADTDVRAASGWRITVRDDATGAVYLPEVETAACGGASPCAWDANRNGAMWVRAEATVGRWRRAVVTLVRQNLAPIALPRHVITAGWFRTTNNGRKVIVDEKGCQAKHRPSPTCNSVDPAPIVVRCTTSTPGTSNDACLGYRSDQVFPNNTTQGYGSSVLPAGQLQQLRAYARQLGTYYTTCPPVSALSGPAVFIEGVSCSYNANGVINSPASPGVLVISGGTLTLSGTLDFYGLIYSPGNISPSNAAAVSLQGNAYVQGAIHVDGAAGVLAGSSGLNISFDPTVFDNILGVGGPPSAAQGSFRELPAGY